MATVASKDKVGLLPPITTTSNTLGIPAFDAVATHLTHDQLSDSPVQLHPPDEAFSAAHDQHGSGSKENTAFGRQDAITHLSSQSALSEGLRIQTNIPPRSGAVTMTNVAHSLHDSPRSKPSSLHSPSTLPFRRPSKKSSTLSTSTTSLGSLTPPSTISSPALNSMLDITPLPSPLVLGGCWDKMAPAAYADPASELSPPDCVLVAANGESISSVLGAQQKRKSYGSLSPNPSMGPLRQASLKRSSNAGAYARNRDVSEYVPERAPVGKPRHVTVSDSGGPRKTESLPVAESTMKREQYLALERGLASPVVIPPTPPPTNLEQAGSADDPRLQLHPSHRRLQSISAHEVYEAEGVRDHQRRKWTEVGELGTGTFSRVVLAASEDAGRHLPVGGSTAKVKSLVAVKIVQHGPAGGASEERIETSLKREIEILKAIHHPSLIQLKGVGAEPSRTLLVLSYCAGGDLYEVASERHGTLQPRFIQRIFAELVAATRYLHEHLIVHRDIKLENVLLNIPCDQLSTVADWPTYPYAVVTLTDMGLSRRIDPADPKLHTRCGSEDYASPELLMGQAYDGRQTDAWALGVLLYALMEGALPFDPPPGLSEQQKTRNRIVHRIARCDWSWCAFTDDEGEPGNFGALEGARPIVEGLLKRATRRLDLTAVAASPWVQQGIQLPGGLAFPPSEEDQG